MNVNSILSLPKDLDGFINTLKFQNYHRHTSYSNTSTPDSGAVNQDYIDRAIELGHTIVSTCEHGFQGNYWEIYSLITKHKKKYNSNLKFVFGAEAYWVKDRLESDRSNNHICLFAKNEMGRRAINEILSEANETGFYFKPRIDEQLIFSLPPKDVFITTACLAFWKYDMNYTVNLIKRLKEHFQENFMLEVQYHNTEQQKEINKNILLISKKLNIPIIMGCDSHYIYEQQEKDRGYILEYKHITYADEDGWFLDYPDTKTAFERFKIQNVLSELEILNSINNTNIFLDFDDIEFDYDIKLPDIHKNLTREEKNNLYKQTIANEFKRYCERYNITNKKEIKKYKDGIKQEVKCVIDTNMVDYFLLDYELIKEGKKRGGVVTQSGRGSAVSYFTNTLLGFSNIDRFIAPVQLYPERFMSTTRILQTKSLPDIDMNLGTVEIFAEVQSELVGKEHAYPMIAYGTLKKKSAWKMYAGANNVDIDIANDISKMLEKYEEDLKNADEDEKDLIDVYEYIPKEYHKLFDESEKYQGIIMDKKKAPCGYVLFDKFPIRSYIGLMKCKSETTKKEYIVACLDGKYADEFKFLKNDLLKVDVSLLHKLTADRINQEVITVRELLEVYKNNPEIWKFYERGITLGINQCEGKGTTKKVMHYKPINDAELCCFIAGIRPSFKSMYSQFSNREHFEYGIKAFDKVVQTDTIKDSFLFFQEQIMSALSFSGIPMDECYGLIKAISKKKEDFIRSYKEQFLKGFSKKCIEIDGCSDEEAYNSAIKVWTIIDNASKYGFNASHAYCMAIDSMMDMYYKYFYTYEFYEVRLNHFYQKGKKDKVALYKQEMDEAFGIKEGDLKFGCDNRQFTLDRTHKCINPALGGVKGVGKLDGEELYALSNKQYNNFIELYMDIANNTKTNKGKVDTLIKLDYFKEFGKSKKLLQMADICNNLYNRKQINKTDVEKLGLTNELLQKYSNKTTEKLYKEIDMVKLIEEITKNIENKDIPLKDKIKYEIEFLGYPRTLLPDIESELMYVIGIDTYENKKSFTHYPTLYNVKTGEQTKIRVGDFRYFCTNKFKEGDIISILSTSKKPKRRKDENGNWYIVENEFNTILDSWEVF